MENLGTTALSIRIGMKSGTAVNSPGFVSTVPFSLPSDSSWHHATFLIDASDLTLTGSGLTLSSLLSNVAQLRIINAANPSLTGDSVVSQLGVVYSLIYALSTLWHPPQCYTCHNSARNSSLLSKGAPWLNPRRFRSPAAIF